MIIQLLKIVKEKICAYFQVQCTLWNEYFKFSLKKAGVPHVAGDLYGKGGRYVFILRGERWKGYLLIVAFLFVPVLLIGLESLFIGRSFFVPLFL
jgi:hypothetical protein